jgi:glycine cleavage system H protein
MYPEELKYSDNSLWVKIEDGNKARAGITSFYSEQVTKTIFVELPEEGIEVKKGEPFGSLESSKSINDLNSPITGKVIAVNHALDTNPGLTNVDPYGQGWMVLIEMRNPAELSSMMSAKEYEAFVKNKIQQQG